MTIYEALNLMIAFSGLIVTLLALSYTFTKKK
ncbi:MULTISPECIES: putative holin-like toxin [Sporosarcina]|uniref:Holin-like toxin n=1 Tax=Sporosarcina contaminans TaxID=633403 RepID=A0ABW3TVW0_9BACL